MSGDRQAFEKAARAYIEDERRKNHHVLARELEKVLLNAPQQPAWLPVAHATTTDLPHDQERGFPLVQLREPVRPLDSLVLHESCQKALARVVVEHRRSEVLRSFGLRPKSRLLFFGPPGCGKSVAAEALANELGLPFAVARFDAIVSSFLGETAANLSKVLGFARGPMVLLFDEFDAIGKSRRDETEHSELRRTVNAFLQMLDAYKGDAIIIAATNQEDLLDRALWRRFDEVIEFSLPTPFQIQLLLKNGLRQMDVEPAISFERLSSHGKGLSHADIEAATNNAIKSAILAHSNVVTLGDLQEAIEDRLLMQKRQHPKRRR